MKKIITFHLVSIMILTTFGTLESNAQSDEGFIYGKITTTHDKTYEGPIRWGDEEVFWFDIFNSEKIRNKHLKHLSWKDMEQLEEVERDNTLNILWFQIDLDNYNERSDRTHLFSTCFGNIESLEMIHNNQVKVTLKKGKEYVVEGYSNDIGATVSIHDTKTGQVKLRWNNIEKVEFMPAPKRMTEKFGNPLYGTVKTSMGEFTGFVQWDHQERISTDKLDGDNRDGEISILFGNIKKIEKSGNGSRIYLTSGEDIYLSGSNDVNYENRGIIVSIPGMGRVDIPWKEFEEVTFDVSYGSSGKGYNEYGPADYIKGLVTDRDGNNYKGIIAFDLDETFDSEILEGYDEGIKYVISFRDIKSIQPKNFKYSTLELRNGKSVLLGNEQDVSAKNDGLLLYMKDKEKKYIPWPDVEKIVLYE